MSTADTDAFIPLFVSRAICGDRCIVLPVLSCGDVKAIKVPVEDGMVCIVASAVDLPNHRA